MGHVACTNLHYIQARHPKAHRCCRALDGRELPVEFSSDSHIENTTYNDGSTPILFQMLSHSRQQVSSLD